MFKKKKKHTQNCHLLRKSIQVGACAKRGCSSYLGADRCRNLCLRPVASPRRCNQTTDLRNLRRLRFKCSNAPPKTGVVSGRRPRQRPANKIHRRSQFGQGCCAGKTGVITVFWSRWERGASSSSLLGSGGRRLSSQHPRLRASLSLAFVRKR